MLKRDSPATQASPEAGAAPLDWIILKLVEVCNINCSYCYIYNRGDESWRQRPRYIADATVRLLAERVREHCDRYSLEEFVIELHGGEPLLIGKRRFATTVETFRSICDSVRLRFVLQTNGLLLDREWLDLFADYGVSFGISIDGPPEVHDRNRVYKNGRGTAKQLLSIIESLRGSHQHFARLFGGVLCVVDPSVHGGALVRWFVENHFDTFEFLLPDATYENLPRNWNGAGDYRRFLVEAFHEWYGLGERAPRIRMFESMMAGFIGHKPTLDALGGDIRRLCVVETDGGIGVSDVLRICSEYANDTLSIMTSPLDAHVNHYKVAQIQEPCATCRSCPFFLSCGGGYLPHRHAGKSFDHPSVYCDALFGVLKEMHDRLRHDLPAHCWTGAPIQGRTRAQIDTGVDPSYV